MPHQTPETQWHRLPGRSRPRFGLLYTEFGQLWESHEQLLYIRIAFVHENYIRLNLRDIESITATRTRNGAMMNAALLLAALLFTAASLAFIYGPYPVFPAAIAFASLTIPPLLFLLWNTALGPTARCTIQTAVQTVDITCLRRWRTAQRALRRLTPKITQAQQPPGP